MNDFLVETLRAHLIGRTWEPTSEEVADLEATLQSIVAEARAATADVVLDPGLFIAHLAGRLSPEGALDDALAEIHAADLFVACGCALGVPSAVACFERDYLSQLPRLVGKMRLDDHTVAEIGQHLLTKLLVASAGAAPKIADYSGRGALLGWLRVAAVRTGLDLRRRAQREAPLPDDLGPQDLAAAGADPELDLIAARYRGLVETAFRQALVSLPGDERNLLRWYFLDRLTVQQMGSLLGVNKSTVSRRLAKARQGILDETRRHLHQELGTSPTELQSILRVVRSQIQVSIGRHLKE